MQGEEQDKPQKWGHLMEQLLDNVFGKGMSITYEFKDLTIDLSNAEVSEGKKIGSGQWKINGKITINATAHNEEEGENKSSLSYGSQK